LAGVGLFAAHDCAAQLLGTTARHIWYDRFERKGKEGSDIDRLLRISMLCFILGALPQAIKVFAMAAFRYTDLDGVIPRSLPGSRLLLN
jgi:hypothetical protein